MNKSKNSMRKIGKYLREISVVVIGVAVTVGVGLWVNNNNIKKDQKQYIDAIILELKENAEKFDNYAKMQQKCIGYSNYLNSHNEKSLNWDSIRYYAYRGSNGIGWGNNDPVILYNEDAFEMFKSSGAMRQIDNKELLLSIWKVYNVMRNAQNNIDDLIAYKKEQGMEFRHRVDNGEKNIVPLKWFYVNNCPLSMREICEDTAEFIRETVSKLEESKIVK